MKIFKTWCFFIILSTQCLTATDLIIILKDSSRDTIDIRAIETGYFIGTSGRESQQNGISSKRFALFQNYPNPFNNTTIIPFWLPTEGIAKITIYDLLGRKVVSLTDRHFSSGYHRIPFTPKSLTSGEYLYILEAGDWHISRKFTLIK